MNKNRYLKHSIYYIYEHKCYFCGLCNEYVEIPRIHIKTKIHNDNFKNFNTCSNIFVVDF